LQNDKAEVASAGIETHGVKSKETIETIERW